MDEPRVIISRFTDDFRWLSNFYPVYVTFEGVHYPSVEHAYQAAKTLNPVERNRIFECVLAGEAKRRGKLLTKRPDWENIKLDVMRNLVWQKFNQPPGGDQTLKLKLMLTGDAELIEGNNWNDTFWGVCNGVGENHLGKILMDVRKEVIALSNML